MKIAVFEHFSSLTGEARRSDPVEEGRAMRDAVVADFLRLPGIEVTVVDRRRDFSAALGAADAALVIAPETDGILERLCSAVERRGRVLLGPSSSAVRLAADKLAMIRRLRAEGVRAPRTESVPFASALRRLRATSLPFVLKPRDGCGCRGVVLVRRASEIPRALGTVRRSTRRSDCLVQEYVGGKPVSVSFVISGGSLDLGLNLQRLTWRGGRPSYVGGETFWPHPQSGEAVAAASAAIDSLTRACRGVRGYLGVDLVLAPNGPVVIEVNPRLTTSYLGLRRSIRENLADLIRRSALRMHVPESVTPAGRYLFRAGGVATELATATHEARPSRAGRRTGPRSAEWRTTSAGISAASI